MLELGGYQLDQDIQDVKVVMEDMSHVLGIGPFPRMFPDEKIFKAPEVNFLDAEWECMLGVANHKIYKIALSARGSNIFEKANIHFLQIYGNPTKSEGDVNIWDFPSSNLVVSKHKPFSVINVIITSGTPFSSKIPVPKASGCFTLFIVVVMLIMLIGCILLR